VELDKVLADVAKKKATDRLFDKLGINESKDGGDKESDDPKEKLKKSLRGLFGK
jgi:hypothetical protein